MVKYPHGLVDSQKFVKKQEKQELFFPNRKSDNFKVFCFFSEVCEKTGIAGITGTFFPNRKWVNSESCHLFFLRSLRKSGNCRNNRNFFSPNRKSDNFKVFCFFSEVCEKAGIAGIVGTFFFQNSDDDGHGKILSLFFHKQNNLMTKSLSAYPNFSETSEKKQMTTSEIVPFPVSKKSSCYSGNSWFFTNF